jgi:hypothetical protein
MIIAMVIVAIELGVIAWIRHRYMDTPLLSATFQVVVGGVLVSSWVSLLAWPKNGTYRTAVQSVPLVL